MIQKVIHSINDLLHSLKCVQKSKITHLKDVQEEAKPPKRCIDLTSSFSFFLFSESIQKCLEAATLCSDYWWGNVHQTNRLYTFESLGCSEWCPAHTFFWEMLCCQTLFCIVFLSNFLAIKLFLSVLIQQPFFLKTLLGSLPVEFHPSELSPAIAYNK